MLLGKQENYGDGLSERDIFYKVLLDLRRDVNDLKKVVFGLLDGTQTQTSVNPTPVSSSSNPAAGLQISPSADTMKHTAIQPTVDAPVIIKHNPSENQEVEHEYIEAESYPATEDNLSLEEKEIEMIRKALDKNKGRRKKAAEALGISERTLYRKIKQYELE
jgi:DNA-binding NtrC family response regulator